MTATEKTALVWRQPGDSTAHQSRNCAPPGSVCHAAAIRRSECSGDYAVTNAPPWNVLGDLCHCRKETPCQTP
jgi:hypothetical protein